ncbi:hypothetical protein L195_g063385, partial [Trifolium pratense]
REARRAGALPTVDASPLHPPGPNHPRRNPAYE